MYESCSGNDEEIAFSVDEMTGVQALERIAPDLALAPGKPLAREFEYKRHGTQTLIAALRVAMGSVPPDLVRLLHLQQLGLDPFDGLAELRGEADLPDGEVP